MALVVPFEVQLCVVLVSVEFVVLESDRPCVVLALVGPVVVAGQDLSSALC